VVQYPDHDASATIDDDIFMTDTQTDEDTVTEMRSTEKKQNWKKLRCQG
jgi:hypothetical protein